MTNAQARGAEPVALERRRERVYVAARHRKSAGRKIALHPESVDVGLDAEHPLSALVVEAGLKTAGEAVRLDTAIAERRQGHIVARPIGQPRAPKHHRIIRPSPAITGIAADIESGP